MNEKIQMLLRSFSVPAVESEEARRRRLLNVVLLAMVLATVLGVLMMFIAVPTGLVGGPAESRGLWLGIALGAVGVGVTYALNRYVSERLSSAFLVLLFFLLAIFSDDPQQVINGRGLFMFSIPIVMASVLLRPWASFVVAGVSSLALFILALQMGDVLPNFSAMIVFFLLALIVWLSAISLERALDRLRALNEALQANERRYRSLFENTQDALLLADDDGRYVDVNPAACELLGYRRKELLELSVWDITPVPNRDQGQALWEEFIAAGEQGGEYALVRQGGGIVWADYRAVANVLPGLHLSVIRDVTERKQAEEALRESEARYRRLVESSDDLIFSIDRDGIFTTAGGKRLDEFGLAPADVVGRSLEELFGDLAQRYQERHDRVFESGEILSYEHRFEFGNVVRTDLTTIYPIEGPAGEIEQLGVICRDITERKKAKDALVRSEATLKSIFRAAPIGIGMVVDRIFEWTNDALQQMTGYAKDELLGQSARMLYESQEEYERVGREKYAQVKRWGTGTIETRFQCKDGSLIDVLLSSSAIDPTDLSAGVTFTALDITERLRAERERAHLLSQVQEQAEQMEQVMDTVPEGVLVLDAARKVVLSNPVAEKYLIPLADAGLRDTLTHLGDRSLDELLTSPPSGLWHEVRVNGPWPQVFEVIARPLGFGVDSEGWVLVLRDVTQEREIQRRAGQQERLAAVGQLAAGIAHDFNNIMASIVLYASILNHSSGLTTKDRERLDIIKQQGHRAASLVQQILDFARQSVIQRRPLNLVSFLKELKKLLARTLPENISLHLEYEQEMYGVKADPTRIQQAVMNLALNARDAMPEGGELRMELDLLRVTKRSAAPLPDMGVGEWIRLTVSDTGEGIPPEVLPHIFEPFFTTKAPGQGTGLGLAQVYGIVKQHEGGIDVASQVGQGATFTIYLPALPMLQPPENGLELQDLPHGRGETILVVEDDTSTRRALKESLQLLDYAVLIAVNGQEALDIFEQRGAEIAMILSDVVMPEMGGAALLHALRQKGVTVPIVMLTGHLLGKEMERLQAQGMTDWLPKPPNLKQLANVVARALGMDLTSS